MDYMSRSTTARVLFELYSFECGPTFLFSHEWYCGRKARNRLQHALCGNGPKGSAKGKGRGLSQPLGRGKGGGFLSQFAPSAP